MTRPPSSGSASAQGARRRSRNPSIALHPDDHTALTDEVSRFEHEIRELALAVVRSIVEKELDRRATRAPRGRAGARTADRAEVAVSTRPREPAAPAAPAAQDTPSTPTAGSAEPSQGAPGKRKRVPWTRESIVSELATWMLSGTAIDAAFVARYGPPGLVAAARRIFGRFEAALNVAGLHASKIAPEEPPAR
jgi:hypothetical protein